MWSSNLDNSATFDGGFANATQNEDQNVAKTQKAQTVVPVMIEHLLSATATDDTAIWGIPARIFKLIGIVRNVEETTTKISYDIEDETGTIVALKWLEADRKESERTVQLNAYTHVIGLLREQNEKRHLLILRMWPMQSLNELTNHLLEVTFVSLKGESLSTTIKSPKDENSSMAEASVGQMEDNSECGMTMEQKLVYKLIKAQNDTLEGIERSEVKAKVPASLVSKIDSVLDFLVSEGHIYTTSTDDHFKTT